MPRWMSYASDLSYWGLDAPLTPFDTHGAPGQAALLCARGLLLASVWWVHATRGDPDDRRGDISPSAWIAVVGAGFIGSLVARALFFPFALLSLVAVARSPRALLIASVILVLGLLAGARPGTRGEPYDLLRSDANPADQTRLWSTRDNAFRARFWAEQWAATEGNPGEGRLALARADWALGHAEEARRLAAQVAAEAPDGVVRQRASAQLTAWIDVRR